MKLSFLVLIALVLGWAKNAPAQDATSEDHLERGDALLGQSLHGFERDKLAAAIGEYRGALRLDPSFVDAHFKLATALEYKDDVDGAIVECREAIRLKPGFGSAHSSLARLLDRKHDVEGALAEYREAAHLLPGNPLVHSNLAQALQAKGDQSEAVAEYKRACELAPSSPDLVPTDLRQYICEHASQREAAVPAPDSVVEHLNLARALEASGQHEASMEEHRKACKISSDSPNVLALCLSASGVKPFPRDEYGVYSAFLKAYCHSGICGESLSIAKTTVTKPKIDLQAKDSCLMRSSKAAAFLDAVGNYERRLSTSGQLEPKLNVVFEDGSLLDYRMLSPAEADEFIKKRTKLWRHPSEKLLSGARLISVSPVGFSLDRSEAVMYWEDWLGPKNAGAQMIHFVKDGNNWIETEGAEGFMGCGWIR